MKKAIIQKGTGMKVGEVDGDRLYIDTQFFQDQVLDAVLADEPEPPVKFKYYLHDESMLGEIVESLMLQLGERNDLDEIARRLKDQVYEVGVEFEWNPVNNKLKMIGKVE